MGLVGQFCVQLNTLAAGLSGRSLQEIRSELGVDSKATLDDMEALLADRAADIKHMSEQNRLAEFVDSSKEKKVIEQPAETVGNDDAYSRRREWEKISQGSLPDDFEKHIELISRWISEPEKPRSDNRVGGSTVSGSEWPILKWLLGLGTNRMSNILAELVKQRPGLAISLAEEVMRRGKRSAYYFEGPNRFSGWAQNVIGRHIHRAHVEFAVGFQTEAESLGIAFDEQYRISELPYLNARSESPRIP